MQLVFLMYDRIHILLEDTLSMPLFNFIIIGSCMRLVPQIFAVQLHNTCLCFLRGVRCPIQMKVVKIPVIPKYLSLHYIPTIKTRYLEGNPGTISEQTSNLIQKSEMRSVRRTADGPWIFLYVSCLDVSQLSTKKQKRTNQACRRKQLGEV